MSTIPPATGLGSVWGAVFISYRHENAAYSARVRSFAERLKAEGFRVIFDKFAEELDFNGGAPTNGWPIWSTQAASKTPSVIAIASSGWFQILNHPDPVETGIGAATEAAAIYHKLVRTIGHNNFLCIGFFDQATDLADLPAALDGCAKYDLTEETRLASLIQWLKRPLSSPPTGPSDSPGGRPTTMHSTPATRPVGVRAPLQLPPAAVAKFYGRVKESRELEQRLRDRLGTAVVGPAGYGKTALAAKAVEAVVGRTASSLAASPYPDGVVFLDLYTYHGQAEPIWHVLANALGGPEFLPTSPACDRATEACRDRQVLVIIEGGEEADGTDGRSSIGELLSVLSFENRCLLLTRDIRQAVPGSVIRLEETLNETFAGQLFDALTAKRVKGKVRERILHLLAGHPLGLTWAGGLLALDDEDPSKLADDWEADASLHLRDPHATEHTLEWLFARSVRGLDEAAKQALEAAGLLARAPFPIEAIDAAIGGRALLPVALDSKPIPTPVNEPTTDAHVGGHLSLPVDQKTKPDGQECPSSRVREALKLLIDRGLLRRTGMDGYREFTHVLGYQFARNESASDSRIRKGLADWLHKRLMARLAVGAGSTEELADLLQHATALLRADHDQELWDPLAYFLLYKGRNRLVSLGRLDWVNTALGSIRDWLDRFPAQKSAESTWQRERTVCFNRLGDLVMAQGNLPEAQRLFGESLRIAQRLAESDPANTEWQRDLSVSFNKLGDLAAAQGNLPEAQRLFGEDLRITKRLAESDPADTEWQRDLSVSFSRLGNLAMAQGNLPEAQRLFGETLGIRQRLVASDVANAGWKSDLSYSYYVIGQLLGKQQRWNEALRLFEQSLAIDERLATLDPTNVTWQEDVQISRQRVAEARTNAGKSDG